MCVCVGGGGGGGSRPNCQKTARSTLFSFFLVQLILQFYIGLSIVENYNFPGFQRGSNIFQGWSTIFQGGPTFSRDGGGGGV